MNEMPPTIQITSCPACRQIIFPPQLFAGDFWICPKCKRQVNRSRFDLHVQLSKKNHEQKPPTTIPSDWKIYSTPQIFPPARASRAWIIHLILLLILFGGFGIIQALEYALSRWEWGIFTMIGILWFFLNAGLHILTIFLTETKKSKKKRKI